MIDIAINKTLQKAEEDFILDINLHINEGDFLAVRGVSGSGKSTMLRILAGLEDAKGEIKVSDTKWLDSKICLAVQKRQIGFVFQDYALFENMSVTDNLLFVAKDKELAHKLLEITHLTSLKNRMPNKLSGGEKQRVALCRALMKKPKLLLLDEPLSALDPKMRAKLQDDILALHKEFKITTIMVSHDPSEIYKLANRLVTLENGKITEDATPKELLLKIKGSQKFSLNGELLEIIKADIIYIAVVAIGQNIVKIVIDEEEKEKLNIGDKVQVSTKAFAPHISNLDSK